MLGRAKRSQVLRFFRRGEASFPVLQNQGAERQPARGITGFLPEALSPLFRLCSGVQVQQTNVPMRIGLLVAMMIAMFRGAPFRPATE